MTMQLNLLGKQKALTSLAAAIAQSLSFVCGLQDSELFIANAMPLSSSLEAFEVYPETL
jgi:hypothetical protein